MVNERIIKCETLLYECVRLLEYLCDTYDEREKTYSMTKLEGVHIGVDPHTLLKKITDTL